MKVSPKGQPKSLFVSYLVFFAQSIISGYIRSQAKEYKSAKEQQQQQQKQENTLEIQESVLKRSLYFTVSF